MIHYHLSESYSICKKVIHNSLCEGGFGTVRAAIRKSDNMPVAIKEVRKGNIVNIYR